MSDEFIRRSRNRRSRRPGRSRAVIVVIAGLLIVWYGWSNFKPKPTSGNTSNVNVTRPGRKTKPSVIAPRTVVILGLEQEGGQTNVTGVLELIFDPAKNRVGGLIIDPATYVSIPGRGFQSMREGYAEGAKPLQVAVNELIGIESEGYLTVKNDVFSNIIEKKNLTELYSRHQESNIAKGKLKTLTARIGGIPKDRVSFLELPVKTIIIGEQSYYEPVREDLRRLVKMLWGRRLAVTKQPIRVIILNGSGTPGIARLAADRLIGKGFKVVDVKNADNFDYAKTQVLLYSRRAKKSGQKVTTAIGAGVVLDKYTAQDVTDIVIVVGKDFH